MTERLTDNELQLQLRELTKSLVSSKTSTAKEIVSLGGKVYNAYEMYFTNPEVKQNNKVILNLLCKEIAKKILPKFTRYLEKGVHLHPNIKKGLFELWHKFYALSSRYDFKQYLLYTGLINESSFWQKALSSGNFDGYIYYVEKFAFTDEVLTIVLSMPPGCGKSYILDMTSSWLFGTDERKSILRISFSDQNVITSSVNIREMMRSTAYQTIYPDYQGERIFSKEQSELWTIAHATNVMASHYAVPRGGQINGKRSEITILDDILKDETEANNAATKENVKSWYWNNVVSRKHAGKEAKLIIGGTIWAPDDLMQSIRNQMELIPTKFKFTEKSINGKIASINIPAIDEETGVNNVSYAHSDYHLETIRTKIDDYTWYALYQGMPIAQSGMEFTWNVLRQYENVPDGEKSGVYAVLDPARKGKNYVSMPIFYQVDNLNYLVDIIYRKKSMKELYDVIVEKIIFHKINYLTIENNTDTSLKEVIEMKLETRGYFGVKIEEIYAVQNKDARIKNYSGDMKQSIIYPKKGIDERTELGLAMKHLNIFSFEVSNKQDDFPDALAMFCQKYIGRKTGLAKIKALSNPFIR